jgi:hypothetical protein
MIAQAQGQLHLSLPFFFSILGWSGTESTISEVTSGPLYHSVMMMVMTMMSKE